MGGSLSIWHWMIVLVIVMVVFGTRKLRNAGGDLGAAVRDFKVAVKNGEAEGAASAAAQPLGIVAEHNISAQQRKEDLFNPPPS